MNNKNEINRKHDSNEILEILSELENFIQNDNYVCFLI
jgi:hypothetical protein